MSEQMNSMLAQANPQLARILDMQARDKAMRQRMAPEQYGSSPMGMFLSAASGANKALTEGGRNLANNVMGVEPPKGPRELQAEGLKAQLAQQKAKKQEVIQGRMATAEQILQNNPGIPEAKAQAMRTTIRADVSGSFADQVIKQYGTPELQDKFKVAGNNIFNTETEEFIKAPTTKKETVVTLEKLTGLDLSDFSTESQKEAVGIMLDETIPLNQRVEQAKSVLQEPEGPLVSERRLDNLVNTIEEADIAGSLSKFNVITQQGELLNRGVTTGFGAEALTTIASMGKQLGVLSDEQVNVLANTQTFTANAGNLVAQVIKAFGAGTGLSDADRQYAATIAGADITKSELSLRRILDIQARNTLTQIETYNKNIKSLMKSDPSWADELKEVPRFRRLDMDAVKRQPNSKIRIPGTDEYYWVDNAKDGYTGEVYDSEGYRLPFAKLDPSK